MAQTIDGGTLPVEGSAAEGSVRANMGRAAWLENDSAAEVGLKPNVRSGFGVKPVEISEFFRISALVGGSSRK